MAPLLRRVADSLEVLGDVVELFVVVLFVVAAHVVLRRHWEVEASWGDHRVTWLLAGWRQTQQTITEAEAGDRFG